MFKRLATLSATRIPYSYSRLRSQPMLKHLGNCSRNSSNGMATPTIAYIGRFTTTSRRAFTISTAHFQPKQTMEEAMNNIEELFSAAKDEMEYAQESVGSVYYHEDRVTADKAVHDCVDAFDKFLTDLPTDEMRREVQGKVGMKIKELKMEYEALPKEGD